MTVSEPFVDAIQAAHVQQLAQFVPAEVKRGRLRPKLGELGALPGAQLASILKWIEDNPDAIAAAKDAQCTSSSPSDPNWNVVFFSMIESAAVYLRKEFEMAKAIKAAKAGDYKLAGFHIKKSQEDIDKVADALGCTYVQLCDFSDSHPKADFFDVPQKMQCGAYCGLFISNDESKPFMGVAYKGTSVTNMREVITDLRYVPDKLDSPQEDVAWGARIHTGFGQGLFGTYKVGAQEATAWGKKIVPHRLR